MQRYGVFKLGQIWSLTRDDGSRIGFSSWPAALNAAEGILEEMRSYGRAAEVMLQDPAGRLITTDRPKQYIDRRGVPQGGAWGGVSGPPSATPGVRY